MLDALRKMRNLAEEEEEASTTAGGETTTEEQVQQPQWMTEVASQSQRFLSSLPEVRCAYLSCPAKLLTQIKNKQTLTELQIRADDSPLLRFFGREGDLLRSLLSLVKSDLQSVLQACNGSRQTNAIRSLMDAINKGECLDSTGLW